MGLLKTWWPNFWSHWSSCLAYERGKYFILFLGNLNRASDLQLCSVLPITPQLGHLHNTNSGGTCLWRVYQRKRPLSNYIYNTSANSPGIRRPWRGRHYNGFPWRWTTWWSTGHSSSLLFNSKSIEDAVFVCRNWALPSPDCYWSGSRTFYDIELFYGRCREPRIAYSPMGWLAHIRAFGFMAGAEAG